MILIGSSAIRGVIEPKDFDIVCTKEERKIFNHSITPIEFHDVNSLNNSEIEKLFDSGEVKVIGGIEVKVCSLEGLKAIKRSHLHRDWFFPKHIGYYHRYLSNVELGEEAKEFLDERTKLTKKEYKVGNPNLNQSNVDFFDDFVKKIYDHDRLHELVAYYDKPIYTRLKKDEKVDLAWCEKDLWEAIPYEDKVKCVAEETYVIGAERFLIPNDWDYIGGLAFQNALQKVCTTLTSGWFRDFAIDNYPQIWKSFDQKKYLKLKEDLKSETKLIEV